MGSRRATDQRLAMSEWFAYALLAGIQIFTAVCIYRVSGRLGDTDRAARILGGLALMPGVSGLVLIGRGFATPKEPGRAGASGAAAALLVFASLLPGTALAGPTFGPAEIVLGCVVVFGAFGLRTYAVFRIARALGQSPALWGAISLFSMSTLMVDLGLAYLAFFRIEPRAVGNRVAE
jgi:hypothetical protein